MFLPAPCLVWQLVLPPPPALSVPYPAASPASYLSPVVAVGLKLRQ